MSTISLQELETALLLLEEEAIGGAGHEATRNLGAVVGLGGLLRKSGHVKLGNIMLDAYDVLRETVAVHRILRSALCNATYGTRFAKED
jgi:hypothetical protein